MFVGVFGWGRGEEGVVFVKGGSVGVKVIVFVIVRVEMVFVVGVFVDFGGGLVLFVGVFLDVVWDVVGVGVGLVKGRW